jgi:hypothetical protein
MGISMNTRSLTLLVSLITSLALAQDAKKTGSTGGAETQAKEPLTPAGGERPKASPEELEAKFKATLTRATLSGRWCGIRDGKLTPEKEDKYTIVSVTKLGGETWIINARIEYGDKNFVAPIPVQVKWAGDTPVITVDNVGIPGGNAYSARVLIYNKTYAGTWSGGDHAGLLNGVITNEKE